MGHSRDCGRSRVENRGISFGWDTHKFFIGCQENFRWAFLSKMKKNFGVNFIVSFRCICSATTGKGCPEACQRD